MKTIKQSDYLFFKIQTTMDAMNIFWKFEMIENKQVIDDFDKLN